MPTYSVEYELTSSKTAMINPGLTWQDQVRQIVAQEEEVHRLNNLAKGIGITYQGKTVWLDYAGEYNSPYYEDHPEELPSAEELLEWEFERLDTLN